MESEEGDGKGEGMRGREGWRAKGVEVEKGRRQREKNTKDE